MQLGPELWKNQTSCSCYCWAWKRGESKKEGKQHRRDREGNCCFGGRLCSTHRPPSVSCSRCHYRTAEVGSDLWRSSLLLWRQQGAGYFEAFWSLVSQAAAYFSCVQSQFCKIFYLLLNRSVCNLLQIYFNISKAIHMKRMDYKTYKLVLHLLDICYY